MFAIDVSTELADFFAEKMASAPQGSPNADPGNIELVITERPPVPLDDGLIDQMLAINLMHELDGHWEALPEMRRLVRDGGRLVVLDWLAIERPAGPPIDHCLDPMRAQALLDNAGFTLIDEPAGAKERFPYHYTYLMEAT